MQVLVTVPTQTPELDRATKVVRGPIGAAPEAIGLLVGPTERVGSDELDLMPALRALAVAGSGTDAVDEMALAARRIQLVSAPDSTTGPTAELTMCLALMVSRGVRAATSELTTNSWSGWSFDHTVGRSLAGLRLGLVGYGRIGQRVGNLAEAFGMDVIHHARNQTGLPGYVPDLNELLAESDIISLHIPLTSETADLIDREAFTRMRTGAAILNTSRGGIVDESALVDALATGRLSGAGIDVFSAEPSVPNGLLGVPNLVITPHIGTATIEARAAMVREASQALLRVLQEATADAN